MALADSVPGVSGGTVAFLLGFYDKFIMSLDYLMSGTKEERIEAIKFLIRIGIGWVVGMGAAVSVLASIFDDRIYEISSLFLGLIIFAIPMICKEEKDSLKGKYQNIIWAVIGVVLVAAITYFNPVSGKGISVSVEHLNIALVVYIFAVAMVAISAMVLPGISGSTMLLIFGLYVPVITALKEVMHLHLSYFPVIVIFGLGILTGIALVIKLIRRALENHRSAMIYFVIGMMIGSLYAIVMGPTTLENTKAAMTLHTFHPIFFIIGIVIVFGLEKIKAMNPKGIILTGGPNSWYEADSPTYHKELFKVDEEGKATVVGGCPPDAFAEDGQVWSNPVYDWEYHKKTDYEWWMKRLRHNFMLYDILRLDHFRGFDEYFEIPAEDETAVNGEWVKGPGMDFFEAMKKELGEKKVIAENLGFLTDSVHKLLDDTGFPGMNVLEFAFGAYDDSIYLPHKYKENSVVYTGTHDNDTVVGWYETLSEDDKKFLEHYLKYSTIERTGTVHLDLISLALESRSDMVIIPLQDYLGLGNEARINTPSTVGGNWEWRVKEEQLTDELKELIRTLTIKYRTVAEENAKKAAEEAQQ